MSRSSSPQSASASPIILAIETSTDICSVGLYLANRFPDCFLVRSESLAREHTRLLLPMIKSLLQEAGIILPDLSVLCCTVGPGSFTGVRIGSAMTQALAFALDKPVVAVSSLRVIAQSAFDNANGKANHSKVIARLCLGQKEIFEGNFAVNELGIMQAVSCERIPDINDINNETRLKEGEGWVRIQGIPDIKSLLKIAKADYEQGRAIAASNLQPVYLNNSQLFKKMV